MDNSKKIRLIQVAKEFKVGFNTLADYLQRKGLQSDCSPSSPVSAEVYAALEKEFGRNRQSGNERNAVRERIQPKGSVSINSTNAKEEDEEVVVKSNVISVKDEVRGPKILGKIDLDGKKKEEPAPVEPKVEPKREEPKPVVVEPKAEPKHEEVKVEPKPAPAPAEPVVEEPKRDSVFRPQVSQLDGPKILGTMDVSNMVPGGKHKRKRLEKEKVNVAKEGKSVGKPEKGGNKGGNNNQPQNNNQQAQQQSKKNKKQKQQPKPVVRPEVSDEEVQKQIKDTLARLTAKGTKSKGAKYRKEKREEVRERMNEEIEREEMERSVLKVTEFVTVSELATMMNVSPMEVISVCMNLGLMVSINQRLDAEALVVVAEEFGFKVEFVSVEIQEAIETDADSEDDLVARPPIVTVMGHVDHGKTSLLDNIRKTNVTAGEAGGITQHIGAYSVELNGQKITFLDTPGHEAFTAMRARGAKMTDVAIIIVAADDSVMPQTVEAINHASAAGVPMVFAINKMDKPQANADHIREQLSQMNYLVEDW